MTQRATIGMSEAQVIAALKAKAEELGGQKHLAAQIRVNKSRVSNVIHGRERPSVKMLRLLGLKKHRVTAYRYFPDA